MKIPGHLVIEDVQIPAGREWMDAAPAWRFLRLARGAAYWLGPKEARPLAEGEVVVAGPAAPGVVRASQLGDVALHSFHFSPAQLCGFLTLAERHYFESRAAADKLEVQLLPSTHPVALRFTELVARPAPRHEVLLRAEALRLVALHFGDDLARHRAPAVRSVSALQHFKEIVEKMPEAELLNYAPHELARLCGCSPRHLSRLFKEHAGISLRAEQTELRLLKASQLLRETDAKIIQVALESGYRNLSLFNAMFKKRFGMTPSEWRRKSAAKPGRLARFALGLLLAAWCGAAPRAAAAAPPEPTAGAAGPAPGARATNAVPTFEVKGYQLLGNTLLPPTVTDSLLRKHTGPRVTFDTIRAALADLQMAYRERGFVTVSVALPQQQLTNGLVRVEVTEGRLAAIHVVNNRYFSSNNVLRALPSLRTNSILNNLVFQQELDRANADRDRQIYPLLGPGPDPGTSDLTLKVKDRLPLHARMELNNDAIPDTPQLRMNVAAQYNNLWQLDHQFGAQYSFTPEEMKANAGTVPFYDGPLIANYSAFYRMPLGGVNGPARDRDYEISEFGYDEATHRFRPPPAIESGELLFYASRSAANTDPLLQSETLTPAVLPPAGGLQVDDRISSQSATLNENLGFRLLRPLPDWWGVRSSFSAGLDFKNFRAATVQSRVFQATEYVPQFGSNGPPFTAFPSPPVPSSRTLFTSVEYLPISLGWNALKDDRFGRTTFNLASAFQFADVVSTASEFQNAAGSTRADGRYCVLTAGATRDQNLYEGWGVRLHADGQWANQPLLSTEQFALGGAPGVRGYYDGAQYGDTGWRAQFEPHTPFLNVGPLDAGSLGVTPPILVRFYSFVDYGQSYLLDPGPRPAAVSLLGAGVGLNCSIGERVDFRLLCGVPLLNIPGTPAGAVRVTFGGGAQF